MCSLVKLATTTNRINLIPYVKSLRLTTGLLSQAVSRPAWGIDPGRNFGLTVIEGEDVYVYHGVLTQTDVPGQYGWLAHQLLNKMIEIHSHAHPANLVIEGASYGDPYGQVLLAEIRGGFYLAGVSASAHFAHVTIKPPKSIRKGVFGDGTIRGPDEWPTLNRNAADSLAMALYAADMEC